MEPKELTPEERAESERWHKWKYEESTKLLKEYNDAKALAREKRKKYLDFVRLHRNT